MADVFISYSHTDQHSRSLAESLARQLNKANIAVWHDQMIHLGDNLAAGVEKQLRDAKIFVFLLGPESLESSWMNFELGAAASLTNASPDVQVIPVVFDGTTADRLPRFLRERVVIDANNETDEQATLEIVKAMGVAA
jgi:hypothetical protein